MRLLDATKDRLRTNNAKLLISGFPFLSSSVSRRAMWLLAIIVLFTSTATTIAASSSPNLPFGDINVLVLTDVHSWIGGNSGDKEPMLNADYGDVLSFYERLKQHCDKNNNDLWFVVNGDWIDGTGLAINGDPSYLIPLLQKMPFDALNGGSNELHKRNVIEYIQRPGGFIDWWGNRFLTSNVYDAASMNPLGTRYRVLRGRNSKVLVFGFQSDMEDNDPIVKVEKVEKVLQADWFSSALHEEGIDAIMVLANMDMENPLVKVILAGIRAKIGADMPVQFINGESRLRRFQKVDKLSASCEAGRYLDTVGFVSFPKKGNAIASGNTATVIGENITGSNINGVSSTATTTRPTDMFKHAFLDANVDVLRSTLGVPTLGTSKGKSLSAFIARTQEDMGLNEVISCISESYFLEKSLEDQYSLWRFFQDHVVPSYFHGEEVLFIDKDSCRHDLLRGEVQVDNVIAVSPFNRTLYLWEELPFDLIKSLNRSINTNRSSYLPMLPDYIFTPSKRVIEEGGFYDLLTESHSVHFIEKHIKAISPRGMGEVAAAKKTNTSMTSIWMNYFLNHKQGICPELSKNKKNHGKATISQPFSNDDRLRLSFAFLSVVIVVALGSVYVWQQDSNYQRAVRERQLTIFEAEEEFENQADDFYEDGWSSDEEGESGEFTGIRTQDAGGSSDEEISSGEFVGVLT